jgi:predicted transcriptional regulator
MVLHSLSVLQQQGQREYVTAREIKEFIEAEHQCRYQIQTIIVVLNRFKLKQLVQRVTFANPEVRERYGYYLCQDMQSMNEDKLWSRFQALADEFFEGNIHQTLSTITRLSDRAKIP